MQLKYIIKLFPTYQIFHSHVIAFISKPIVHYTDSFLTQLTAKQCFFNILYLSLFKNCVELCVVLIKHLPYQFCTCMCLSRSYFSTLVIKASLSFCHAGLTLIKIHLPSGILLGYLYESISLP